MNFSLSFSLCAYVLGNSILASKNRQKLICIDSPEAAGISLSQEVFAYCLKTWDIFRIYSMLRGGSYMHTWEGTGHRTLNPRDKQRDFEDLDALHFEITQRALKFP